MIKNIVFFSFFALKAGDSCDLINGGKGICKEIENCKEAKESAKNREFFNIKICSFDVSYSAVFFVLLNFEVK